jgi:hypothetical protein
MAESLSFRAGPGALESVRRHGFAPSKIGTMAGASGGAKWLVLSKLDRVVARDILPRLEAPVFLIGSSIGAWRFACYAQDDPSAAVDRFEAAYFGQTYSEKPDREEISAKGREILEQIFGSDGVRQTLSHPVLRTNVMTVRSRHVMASEHPAVLVPALSTAAALNALHRRSLGAFFERVLFHDERDRPPFFDAGGFPMSRVGLSRHNLEDAVFATGSIPLVMSGVRDIIGAPNGIYRDGGVIDYHLDLPHSADERITLTILVSPSREFVDRLPYRKIPDRRDFVNFEPAERLRFWRTVVDMCDELADEFHRVIDKDQLAARLRPL